MESTPREQPVTDAVEEGEAQLSARKSHESVSSNMTNRCAVCCVAYTGIMCAMWLVHSCF